MHLYINPTEIRDLATSAMYRSILKFDNETVVVHCKEPRDPYPAPEKNLSGAKAFLTTSHKFRLSYPTSEARRRKANEFAHTTYRERSRCSRLLKMMR